MADRLDARTRCTHAPRVELDGTCDLTYVLVYDTVRTAAMYQYGAGMCMPYTSKVPLFGSSPFTSDDNDEDDDHSVSRSVAIPFWLPLCGDVRFSLGASFRTGSALTSGVRSGIGAVIG